MPVDCLVSYNNGKTAVTPVQDATFANVALACGGDPLAGGYRTFTFGDATNDPRVLPKSLLEGLVACKRITLKECTDSSSFGWYVPFSNGQEDPKWTTTTEDFVTKFNLLG